MQGRSIGAAFAGILAGVVIAFFLRPVIDGMYPIDQDVFASMKGDREAMYNYIKNMPAGYHLLGIGAGVLRLLIALIVGSLIDKKNLMTLIVISAFCILLAVLDIFAMPNPAWYGLVYIPALIGVTLAFIYTRKKA